jgi:putative ATPase
VLERLQAQLQLLDQLRRPRLLEVAPEAPERLQALVQAPTDGGGRFEWIAARQPWRHCTAEQRLDWLKTLTDLAAPGASARLLFSHPLLGPAGSLSELLGPGSGGSARRLLESAALSEQSWLAGEAVMAEQVRQELEALGWSVQQRIWEERLDLPLGEGLLQRWFGEAAGYRQHLASVLPAPGRKRLEALFRERRGASLPQPLRHTLLLAQRPAVSGSRRVKP